jgi:TfoX/Sxy family transcriptional regulator of competence genes
MKDTSYRDYIVEDVLGHIEGITARGMFSGWTIYLDGVVIGLIAEGEFYLKADKELVLKYKKEGLYPFTYTKKDGKTYEMACVNVPIETLEDREKVRERVMESYGIGLNSKKKK